MPQTFYSSQVLLNISQQKRNLVLRLAVISATLMTPFVISNFIQQRTLLATLGLIIIVTYLSNAILIAKRKKHSPLSIQVILVPAIICYLLLSIHEQGLIGILWCYAAILSFYFLLPEKRAWIANFALMAFAVPLVLMTQSTEIGWKIVATFFVVSFLSGIFMSIIRKQREKLQKLAITDPLTGLKNRTNLAEDIDDAIALRIRNRQDATLIMLDVDQFKNINDIYGHEQGDAVLQRIAEVLLIRCRRTDKIYRIGGEEFLIILSQTEGEEAYQLAEELRQQIESLTLNKVPKVTASFGITVWQEKESWQSWLSRCDHCLYKAKEAGRNCTVYCK